MAHILANGGEDPQNSRFIFHFKSYVSLMHCRDSMRITVPEAFHPSPTVVNNYNQMFGLHVAQPIPMAEAWIILKTAILSSDYCQDFAFFVII